METEQQNAKRIVEINGIKVEIDLRTAKRIEEFRVGDGVKILRKDYSGYKSHFGMIVGFDEFKTLPTMIVAYLETSNWEDPLKICYLNNETKDTEICAHDPDDLGVEKADILNNFSRKITAKELEIEDLKRKRDYFERMFGKYFPVKEEQSAG